MKKTFYAASQASFLGAMICVGSTSAFVPAVGYGQLSPEEAHGKLVAGEGVRVEVFAYEPQVFAPTAIDIDELGRVWVAEGVNYRKAGGARIEEPPYFPSPLRKTGDRIVVLEDTDGDGRCDRSRLFHRVADARARSRA